MGLLAGQCPACYAGQNSQRQKLSSALDRLSGSDLSALAQWQVADDATLTTIEVSVLDENGNLIMEATGQAPYQFNPIAGQIDEVPVIATRMALIPQEQLDVLILQGDQALDALAEAAVNEVSE